MEGFASQTAKVGLQREGFGAIEILFQVQIRICCCYVDPVCTQTILLWCAARWILVAEVMELLQPRPGVVFREIGVVMKV